MSNLLTKLNTRLEDKVVLTEEEKLLQALSSNTSPTAEEADSIKRYEEWMAEKTIIRATFSSSDKDGNLYYYEPNTGITVIFMKDDIKKSMPYYREDLRSNFTGRFTFEVRVKSIDTQEKNVYCTSAREPKQIIRAVGASLLKELEAERHPIITGKVTKVDSRYILVDIFERGIKGYLSARDWSPAFTRTLTGKCKVGDYLQFEVTGRMPGANRKTGICWKLSRKNLTPNPWQMVPKEWDEGSIILVKCVEKPNDDRNAVEASENDKPKRRTFFWGQCAICPDLEILCDYTTKVSKKDVIVGETYVCSISKISISEDGKNNVLKASPFKKADESSSPGIKASERKKRKPLEVPTAAE